jgi:hypothetical protein
MTFHTHVCKVLSIKCTKAQQIVITVFIIRQNMPTLQPMDLFPFPIKWFYCIKRTINLTTMSVWFLKTPFPGRIIPITQFTYNSTQLKFKRKSIIATSWMINNLSQHKKQQRTNIKKLIFWYQIFNVSNNNQPISNTYWICSHNQTKINSCLS